MAASDMTFWMVQSHELKFWKTGHALGSVKKRHSLLSHYALTSRLHSQLRQFFPELLVYLM